MSLIETARAVRENAHAPYSKFKVGAAVQAASGTVYVGCNVENVAYPEGTCAEGGAIAALIAGGDPRSGSACGCTLCALIASGSGGDPRYGVGLQVHVVCAYCERLDRTFCHVERAHN